MTQVSEKHLQRNVHLQIILRIFQMRVFLPLTAIYFMAVANFSLSGIGLLAVWFAVVRVVFEVPTGMFADRFGKVLSERLGAALNVGATLLYVFAPFKLGIFAGATLEAVGYSFFGGACEALLHDTLQAQGRISQYTKVLGRIQSASLAVNAVLLALVPLTYKYNHRYPFLLGTVAYVLLFVTTFFLKEVYPHNQRNAGSRSRTRVSFVRLSSQYRKYVLFLLCFGIISALYTAPSDFINLTIRDLGLRPEQMGFLFSAASIVGVVFGWFLHLLKRLPFRMYALLDWAVLAVSMASVWLNKLVVVLVVYIVTMSFWRYRRIIYQEKLLEILQTNKKATALSVMNNATQLNELYLPLLFGLGASAWGIPHTFGIAFAGTLALLGFWIVSLRSVPDNSIRTQNVVPQL